MYDLIIIGSGVSGYAGGMYAARLGLKTLIIGEMPGGAIVLTDIVENYPGFKKISGTELFEKIREHTKEYGVEIVTSKVTKIEKKDEYFVVRVDKGYEAKAILFATGTRHKELKVAGHDKYKNKGVHYCALCDGYFYKNKIVAVIGGSDSAVKDALVLSRAAKKVYVIYRGGQIHPEPINMKRIKGKKNIEIINNTNVIEIKGDEKKVTAVILDKEYNGSKELEVDGVFIAIGTIPLSDLAKDLGVRTNEKDEIIVNDKCETNVKGIFAAGDVTNIKFKQAITGVAQACTAAFFIHEMLEGKK